MRICVTISEGSVISSRIPIVCAWLMNDLDINIGSRCPGRLIIATANNPYGQREDISGDLLGRLVA